MAITFVQARDSQPGNGVTVPTLAFTANNTTGNLLFAIASWSAHPAGGNPSTTCTVTDSQGNLWKPLPVSFTGSTGGSGNSALQGFYTFAKFTAANTVTFTFSGTADFVGLAIGEWSGVNAFNNSANPPSDQGVPAASTTPTSFYAGATHDGTSLVIGYGSTVATLIWTATNGTLRTSSSQQLAISDTTGGNGSYAPAFTISAADSWQASCATFFQTVGGSTLVQEIDHDDGGSTARLTDVFSFALPTTAGNLLFTHAVWLSPSDSSPVAISSVTDDAGNTWTSAGPVIVCAGGSGLGTNGYGQAWYCLGAASCQTVTVNFTNAGGLGGATFIGRAMAEWTGISSRLNYGIQGNPPQSTALSGPSIALANGAALLIGWGITGCGFVPNTPGTGWNQRATNHRSVALMDQYSVIAGTYSPALNTNQSTSTFGNPELWGLGILAFGSGAPSLTQLATDNFTRANENPLSDGGAWLDASSATAMQLLSNTVVASTATGTCSSYFNGGITWPNDQYSECKLGAAPISGQFIGPSVRNQAGVQNFYVLYAGTGTGQTFLQKVTNGSGTTLTSGTFTFHVNDVLRLTIQGSTLTATQNGTTILTATDSTYTSGFPGVAAFADSDSYFLIGPWNGGSLASGSVKAAIYELLLGI